MLALSDILEENNFPSVWFRGGFGLPDLQGIAILVYRAFELLDHMGNESLTITGAGGTVSAWAARKETSVTLLLTNHAMLQHTISTEAGYISLKVSMAQHSIIAVTLDI